MQQVIRFSTRANLSNMIVCVVNYTDRRNTFIPISQLQKEIEKGNSGSGYPLLNKGRLGQIDKRPRIAGCHIVTRTFE